MRWTGDKEGLHFGCSGSCLAASLPCVTSAFPTHLHMASCSLRVTRACQEAPLSSIQPVAKLDDPVRDVQGAGVWGGLDLRLNVGSAPPSANLLTSPNLLECPVQYRASYFITALTRQPDWSEHTQTCNVLTLHRHHFWWTRIESLNQLLWDKKQPLTQKLSNF